MIPFLRTSVSQPAPAPVSNAGATAMAAEVGNGLQSIAQVAKQAQASLHSKDYHTDMYEGQVAQAQALSSWQVGFDRLLQERKWDEAREHADSLGTSLQEAYGSALTSEAGKALASQAGVTAARMLPQLYAKVATERFAGNLEDRAQLDAEALVGSPAPQAYNAAIGAAYAPLVQSAVSPAGRGAAIRSYYGSMKNAVDLHINNAHAALQSENGAMAFEATRKSLVESRDALKKEALFGSGPALAEAYDRAILSLDKGRAAIVAQANAKTRASLNEKTSAAYSRLQAGQADLRDPVVAAMFTGSLFGAGNDLDKARTLVAGQGLDAKSEENTSLVNDVASRFSAFRTFVQKPENAAIVSSVFVNSAAQQVVAKLGDKSLTSDQQARDVLSILHKQMDDAKIPAKSRDESAMLFSAYRHVVGTPHLAPDMKRDLVFRNPSLAGAFYENADLSDVADRTALAAVIPGAPVQHYRTVTEAEITAVANRMNARSVAAQLAGYTSWMEAAQRRGNMTTTQAHRLFSAMVAASSPTPLTDDSFGDADRLDGAIVSRFKALRQDQLNKSIRPLPVSALQYNSTSPAVTAKVREKLANAWSARGFATDFSLWLNDNAHLKKDLANAASPAWYVFGSSDATPVLVNYAKHGSPFNRTLLSYLGDTGRDALLALRSEPSGRGGQTMGDFAKEQLPWDHAVTDTVSQSTQMLSALMLSELTVKNANGDTETRPAAYWEDVGGRKQLKRGTVYCTPGAADEVIYKDVVGVSLTFDRYEECVRIGAITAAASEVIVFDNSPNHRGMAFPVPWLLSNMDGETAKFVVGNKHVAVEFIDGLLRDMEAGRAARVRARDKKTEKVPVIHATLAAVPSVLTPLEASISYKERPISDKAHVEATKRARRVIGTMSLLENGEYNLKGIAHADDPAYVAKVAKVIEYLREASPVRRKREDDGVYEPADDHTYLVPE